MEEDNLSRQADEVEALASIYGDEWCVIDEAHRVYCIQVTDGQDQSQWRLCLQVMFPAEYPSEAPPQYQLNAPWLREPEKIQLSNSLEDIYLENCGESIIYLWVEKIREFLINKSDQTGEGDGQVPSGGKQVNMTEETDHAFEDEDYEFDAALLEAELQSYSDHTHSPEQEQLECPPIHHGDPITEKRSTFQAHLAPIFFKQQVRLVLEKLYENKKIANATHNILAYRIYRDDPVPAFIQGCDDDGETHAGSRMLHLLKIVDARNVMVVVTRWYGGILLGPDRFKHINNCTRNILQQEGYIKEKVEKKGPKSGKKGR